MTAKNSIFTVTPPDLRLSPNGPSIMLLGINLDEATPYAGIYEKLFPEVEVTIFVSDNGFSEETAAWFRATSSLTSSFIVNLDNITIEEFLIATEAAHDPTKLVFWISKNNPPIVTMLSSYQHQIFSSVNEIEQMLMDEFTKNT